MSFAATGLRFAATSSHQTDLAGLAKELVQLKVDVIVAGGVAGTRSAKAATQTMPIVGVGGDPMALGLAQSIAHPGRNFTGFLHGGIDRAKLLLHLLGRGRLVVDLRLLASAIQD